MYLWKMSDVCFQAEFYSSITAAPGLNRTGPQAECHDHNTLLEASFSGSQPHITLVFYLVSFRVQKWHHFNSEVKESTLKTVTCQSLLACGANLRFICLILGSALCCEFKI